MTQVLLPGQLPSGSIILYTKLNNPIENNQPRMLASRIVNEARDLPEKYPAMRLRHGTDPSYNCHGLVFASRRTWIEHPAHIAQILMEDGYKEVTNEADVLPGDVITYEDNDGDISHSGIVLEAPPVSLIFGKWGGFGEVIHQPEYGPYSGKRRYFRVL